MSHESYELKAEAREGVGKGSARLVRRNGKIPAVIYGDKQPPLPITVDYKELYYKIHGGGFMTTIATIDVDGKKVQVLPKDYQLDPVRDVPLHVDFLRVGKDTIVTVNVPVHFVNEEKSPGIKRGGRWDYAKWPCVVATSRAVDDLPANAEALAGKPDELVANLRSRGASGRIWVLGGGDVVRQFLDAGLLDTIEAGIIPVILGSGLPAFGGEQADRWLDLDFAKPLANGAVHARWTVRKA